MKTLISSILLVSATALTSNAFRPDCEYCLTREEKGILRHFSLEELDDQCGGTRTTIRITAANLQVVNGLNATNGVDETPDDFTVAVSNGLGNIIIGYDENSNEIEPNGPKKGSHNLIVGTGHVYDGIGGIIAGDSNVVHGYGNSVLSGNSNLQVGFFGGILSGERNYTQRDYSAVVGGSQNQANDFNSVVVGGSDNMASEDRSVVVGGWLNEALGLRTVVVGGSTNRALGWHSTVSGGRQRSTFDVEDWAAGTLLEDN
jgi:hypothetical protein